MLEFKDVTLNDKNAIDRILKTQEILPCDLCFSNIFLWAEQYHTKFCIQDEMLFIKGSSRHGALYKFPVGTGNVKDALEQLFALPDFQFLHIVTEENRQALETLYPGQFEYIDNRGAADYIYTSEKLRTLSGKKLHAKRNHINKFQSEYAGRHIFEPITEENIPEILDFHRAWCEQNGCDGSLQHEVCAVKKAFAHFSALELSGLCLKIDGKIAAYSYGTALTSDTFVIHAEKADSSIQGSYAVINQRMAEQFYKEFFYINREEDMGLEGLRKAKLSYQPDILRTRYNVQWKHSDSQETVKGNK